MQSPLTRQTAEEHSAAGGDRRMASAQAGVPSNSSWMPVNPL